MTGKGHVLEIISKAMIVTTPQHGPFGLMIYKILYKSPKVMINVCTFI